MLLTGRAAVVIDGERQTTLDPGDGFGEIAVLHRVPRTATVIAEEPCRLLTISGENLRAALAGRGGLIGELAASTAADSSA